MTTTHSPSKSNKGYLKQLLSKHAIEGAAALLFAIFGGILLQPVVSRAQAAPEQSQFMLGADISALDSGNGRGGAVTYQENGVTDTEYAIMMKHGWKTF